MDTETAQLSDRTAERPTPTPSRSVRRPWFQFSLRALHFIVLACGAFCALTIWLHLIGVLLFLLLLGGSLLGMAAWRGTHASDRQLAKALLVYAAANVLAALLIRDIYWGVPFYVFSIILLPLLGSFVVLVLHVAHWSIRFSGLALTGFFVLVAAAVSLNVCAFLMYLVAVGKPD